MTHDDHDKRSAGAPRNSGLSRRSLLRQAGFLGAGALGAGVLGCQSRPEQDFVDLSTEPTQLQSGGTISGLVRSLLGGDPAARIAVRFLGVGEVETDENGRYEIRIDRFGVYTVRIGGPGFHAREGRARITGSAVIDVALLERGTGLPLSFIDEFARGTGPRRDGVRPRTPGATNRWRQPPRVVIYRNLEDRPRRSISDARIAALQGAIAALFAPLTGNALGPAPSVEVRPTAPPADLERVEPGHVAVVQRDDGQLGAVHAGSVGNPFEIAKARIACGAESEIELFNRVFAHALGGWVVSPASDSVLNPAGRAAPSDQDRQAARFLYSRPPGSTSPDVDPAGAFLTG